MKIGDKFITFINPEDADSMMICTILSSYEENDDETICCCEFISYKSLYKKIRDLKTKMK